MTAATPGNLMISVAKHRDRETGQIMDEMFYIGVPGGTFPVYNWSASGLGQVRWGANSDNYGREDLTDLGRKLFDTLHEELSRVLSGRLREIWLGEEFDHLAGMFRIRVSGATVIVPDTKKTVRELAIEAAKAAFSRVALMDQFRDQLGVLGFDELDEPLS